MQTIATGHEKVKSSLLKVKADGSYYVLLLQGDPEFGVKLSLM